MKTILTEQHIDFSFVSSEHLLLHLDFFWGGGGGVPPMCSRSGMLSFSLIIISEFTTKKTSLVCCSHSYHDLVTRKPDCFSRKDLHLSDFMIIWNFGWYILVSFIFYFFPVGVMLPTSSFSMYWVAWENKRAQETGRASRRRVELPYRPCKVVLWDVKVLVWPLPDRSLHPQKAGTVIAVLITVQGNKHKEQKSGTHQND